MLAYQCTSATKSPFLFFARNVMYTGYNPHVFSGYTWWGCNEGITKIAWKQKGINQAFGDQSQIWNLVIDSWKLPQIDGSGNPENSWKTMAMCSQLLAIFWLIIPLTLPPVMFQWAKPHRPVPCGVAVEVIKCYKFVYFTTVIKVDFPNLWGGWSHSYTYLNK